MSLDLHKLEKVRELADGIVQARCPACAEGGHDRTGEHLRIYPDGRFGCCVHPKDGEHRKRVFALVGVHDRQEIRVKVASPQPAKIIQADILGRLGRVFCGPVKPFPPAAPNLRTLRTGQYSYMCEKKNYIHTYKDSQSGVLSVLGESLAPDFKPPVLSVLTQPIADQSESPVPSVPTEERLPFLTPGGDLSIPFDSNPKYHWWKPGGQTVEKTRAEVLAWMKAEGDNRVV